MACLAFGGIPLKKVARKAKPWPSSRLLEFCHGLSSALLTDMLQQAGLDETRDQKTLSDRTFSEGLGFLTKVLPSMGKAILAALKGNRLSIPRFSKQHGTAIPHFLKGLLSRVFDREGIVLEHAEVCSLNDLIQFCFLFYKLEVPYNAKCELRVIENFVRTDAGLPGDYNHLGSPDTRDEPLVLRHGGRLLQSVFRDFDPRDIIPRHGPGAVATGERPHEKYNFRRFFRGVEDAYPYREYFFLSEQHIHEAQGHSFDSGGIGWNMVPTEDPTARVVLVPKDSRGPRLISCEPLEIQYVQQGLGKAITEFIERHPLTRGHVNFTDQTINQRLAQVGSVDGSWVTLDMKDASDRVSLALVRELFRDTGLVRFLEGTRSTLTTLPNGEVMGMRKFAPMGSALCFPIEALCFWALAVACIHVYLGVPIRTARLGVYVYGDDLILRKGYENALLDNFRYFSLKFNTGKCYTTGNFRESCGADAFRGEIISPLRVKSLFPVTKTDGAMYASWIGICNSLFGRCYYRAASYVQKHVEGLYGLVPYSGRDPHRVEDKNYQQKVDFLCGKQSHEVEATDFQSILHGRDSNLSDSAPSWYVRQSISHDQLFSKSRYNPRFQRREYLVSVVRPVSYVAEGTSNWSELMRHLNSSCRTAPHRYTLRRRVKLQRRWTSLVY